MFYKIRFLVVLLLIEVLGEGLGSLKLRHWLLEAHHIHLAGQRRLQLDLRLVLHLGVLVNTLQKLK